MQEVYNRVVAWNAARYPQEYDARLTINLLAEEYLEYVSALETVDQIDGLCDIVFVALGGVWKLGEDTDACTQRSAEVVQGLINVKEVSPVYFISTFITVGETTEYPQMSMLWNILQCATAELSAMGFDDAGIVRLLLAVCDANDTKTAAMTDPTVKANIDKGAGFVPPEPALTKIMSEYEI